MRLGLALRGNPYAGEDPARRAPGDLAPPARPASPTAYLRDDSTGRGRWPSTPLHAGKQLHDDLALTAVQSLQERPPTAKAGGQQRASESDLSEYPHPRRW